MSREILESFDCFGGRCSVRVVDTDAEAAADAVRDARLVLLEAHRTLSRFDPDSELSRLNRDPRPEVPASALLRRLVAAALTAGLRSGGLVDATLVGEIEAAGYERTRDFDGAPDRETPAPRPAAPSALSGWCSLTVDERACTVSRPPGVRIDPGGIAKGLLADLVGESLADFECFAVDCCGDLRIGGVAGRVRSVFVDDPAGGRPPHELRIADGAVATSGITRRAWIGPDGLPAHQILDPASGRPAFTGIVQATAVAPTGLLAETFAKSALLAGPEDAEARLPYGGVIVETGGAVRVVEPPTSVLPAVLVA
ncbi:MAG TPA: FAD:protein FMN transferase [Solirubrobacterales bacterium]|nr:FAD:protein FMN transferase [Solirubrobacterales bacterium]